MTSLYWLKREICYGPLNPDKTFYLIKQPVKENGLTALLANVTCGAVTYALACRPAYEFVDVRKIGDGNK